MARRRMMGGALALIAIFALTPVAAQRAPVILYVNSVEVIDSSDAAQALRATIVSLRQRLENHLETVRAELEAEEQELTNLRSRLPRDEFATRAREFDARVRRERRASNRLNDEFRKFTDSARGELRLALPPVLEALRVDLGADLILEAGAILAADPALNVTAAAIERFNLMLGEITFDPPESLALEAQ